VQRTGNYPAVPLLHLQQRTFGSGSTLTLTNNFKYMVKSHLRHLLRRNITPRRTFTSLNAHSEEGIHSRDFTFWPDFLTLPEQRILLKSSLFLLDSAESRQHQRWRKKSQVSQESPISSGQNTVCSLFLPDERYQFSEVHESVTVFWCMPIPGRT